MADRRDRSPYRRRRCVALALTALVIAVGVSLWARNDSSPDAHASARPPALLASHRRQAPRAVRRARARPAFRHVPARALHEPPRLPGRVVSVPILMYHRIDHLTPGLPAITQALTVSPSDFAGQLAWMKRHGFHTITQMQLWNALMHGASLPPRPVLLTFDDAYRDVVTYAAPVVRQDHDHATAYVITDRLSHGRVTPWMRWNQLPLLERDGFDIGSHTVSHADLVAVGPAQARFQLRASRFALERYLHQPVQWLAYPYGRVDPTVEQLALAAGYVLAVTTEGGTDQAADEPLLLHRDEVTGTMGVAGLANLLGDR